MVSTTPFRKEKSSATARVGRAKKPVIPRPNQVEVLGLEPRAIRLKVECSNQLSYTSNLTALKQKRHRYFDGAELKSAILQINLQRSGQDSNLRTSVNRSPI